MLDDNVVCVFVYGTLKKREVRGAMWPRRPICISPATTKGTLYDLGAYPALRPGENDIIGELWCFEPDDMSETMRVLDEIEDYQSSDDDLYKRVVVKCRTAATEEWVEAYTYHYASELNASLRLSSKQGKCEWNGRK